MFARTAQLHQPFVQSWDVCVERNDEDVFFRSIETLEDLCVVPKFDVHAEAVTDSLPGVSHACTRVGFFPVLGLATLGFARVLVPKDTARARRRWPLKLVAELAA